MSEALAKPNPDRVALWYGKSVDDMTRDELMEAFQQLARMYRDNQAETMHQFDVLRGARSAAALSTGERG
jgi:hypothetical protein